MSLISSMPTGCAPTMSTDPNKIGWNQCTTNCKNCTTCTPDKNTDCGQLMIAAGMNCAPPACASQCCSSVHSPKPTPKPTPKTPFYKTTAGKIAIGVGVTATVVVVALVIKHLVTKDPVFWRR